MPEFDAERVAAAEANSRKEGGVELERRPTWRQAVIFCADASYSMTEGHEVGTKAIAASQAIHTTLTTLSESRVRANFHYAYVTFHDSATVRTPVASAASFNSGVTNASGFDPTTGGTGGTRIHAGLDQAGTIAREFVSDTSSGMPGSAVVLLLSDGECSEADATVAAASRLKEAGVTVAAVLFSKDTSGEATLQACSTGPEFYLRTFDPDMVRTFFIASIKASR